MRDNAAAIVFLTIVSLTSVLIIWMWLNCGVRVRLVPASGVAYDVRLESVRVWQCD